MEGLKAENIGTGVHFRSLHLQPYYRETFGYLPEDFPHALDLSNRILSLPLYPTRTSSKPSPSWWVFTGKCSPKRPDGHGRAKSRNAPNTP
jgi:hypothetical protein